jgi:hypothetical protein
MEHIHSINKTSQSNQKTQDICGSPQCGATFTNCFSFFIILQSLTFILSYALGHRANLHRGQEICALHTKSSFPKTRSRHKANSFIENIALHTCYVAQSNAELIALSLPSYRLLHPPPTIHSYTYLYFYNKA